MQDNMHISAFSFINIETASDTRTVENTARKSDQISLKVKFAFRFVYEIV